MSSREVVLRAFTNQKFGHPFGRSLFHYAIYNGTIEVNKPYAKYLIDLFEYNRWDRTAASPEQLKWSKELFEANMQDEPEVLVSWIKHYNPITKQKQIVDGICVYSPLKQQILTVINDPEREVIEEWTLPTKLCTKVGEHKPVFIATNFDLTI